MRRASSASQNEAATLDNLSFQLVELRLTLESLERERDFYFGKLADIEQVVVGGDCQDTKIRQAVREILYQDEVGDQDRRTDSDQSHIAGLKDPDLAPAPVSFSSVRSKAKVRLKVTRRQSPGAVSCKKQAQARLL